MSLASSHGKMAGKTLAVYHQLISSSPQGTRAKFEQPAERRRSGVRDGVGAAELPRLRSD